MSWIWNNTEKINNTKIYNWFKEKHNLKEAIQIWDSVKVPFLFNRKVAFVFYIEKGFLDFAIYILKEKKWVKGGFSGIKHFHDFDFKLYFNEIN